MTETNAKRIGSRETLKSVVFGLLIAYALMALLFSSSGWLKGLLWFLQVGFSPNILIGIASVFILGFVFGKRIGVEILIRDRNESVVGMKYLLAIVFLSALIASGSVFLQEGISYIGSDDDPFNDYVFKPLFWMAVFGLIPTLLLGIGLGSRIVKQAEAR
jgi:hypothetical protein